MVDLVGGPMLIWKKSRFIALFSHILFHTMNSFVFLIGTFPVMMLFSSFLWLDPISFDNFIKKRWKRFNENNSTQTQKISKNIKNYWSLFQKIFILIHLLIQTLIPLTPYILTNDPCWTKANNYFTWRMMLNEEVNKNKISKSFKY